MALDATRLIFVYNADSDVLSLVIDALHKIIAPATYPCSLCALTYGWTRMHGRWRQFLATLPQTKVFHHRDDFALAFPEQKIALPAILMAHGAGVPQVLVSAAELDALPNLDALIALLATRLDQDAA